MQKSKIKPLIGNILVQVLALAMILLLILLYRIICYQEYQWLLVILGIELIQVFAKRQNWYIAIFKFFEPNKLFDQSIIIQEERNHINPLYCVHPHGVFNYTYLVHLYTKGTFMENLTMLGSRVALYVPIFGLFMKLYGVEGVDAKNLNHYLKLGKPVGINPGGFEESTINTPKENRVYINNRKGFIKYALRHGSTLYPVFNFGENQLFNTFDKFTDFRLWLNKFKISSVFFWSRFGTFPEPHTRLASVCGKGIPLPKLSNPTEEDINRYHQIYIKSLEELYYKYQPTYQPDMPLKIY